MRIASLVSTAVAAVALTASASFAATLSFTGTPTGVAPTTIPLLVPAGPFGVLKAFDSGTGQLETVDMTDPLFSGFVNGGNATTYDSTTAGFGLVLSDPTRQVKVTYLGSEAAFTNEADSTVTLDAGMGFNNKTSEFGEYFIITPGTALIPLLFTSTNFGPSTPVVKNAENGGPIDSPLLISFSDIFADVYGNPGRSVYAFLGDENNEDDIDDIRVRIDVVPLPAAVWMFGAALAGLGLLGRSRKTA